MIPKFKAWIKSEKRMAEVVVINFANENVFVWDKEEQVMQSYTFKQVELFNSES
ncbi:hypothetical protein [Bombilactobacillus bombi]|uniref:hypothetical protein n=1 Tax=Bombilactobacillus bombi TaxID=1303590 RepID=UPI0015F8D811|nr:hypothetical protein [Bombilactobacillus bombi]